MIEERFMKKSWKTYIEKKIKSDYKRGWGMSLSRQLMDSVEVSNDEYGCTIILKRGGINEPDNNGDLKGDVFNFFF